MNELRVWIPFLPPSSNKIYEPVYVRGKPKGKRLSSSGRRFKIRAMQTLQNEGKAALLNLPEDVPYELTLAIFLEHIENKGWLTGKTDRYKKVDITNRIKLVEDTVSEAVGVDDKHNFRIIVEKHCDADEPGIYVVLSKLSDKEVGLRKEEYIVRLRRPEPHRARGVGSAAWFAGRASRSGKGRADSHD